MESKHSPLCRREIRAVKDHGYYEMFWVCVKNCEETNA